MNFVIPMAGKGQRFKKAGFTIPKMLIEAHGKTLLEWSVDSLPLEICTNLIFIGLREHQEKFDLETIINEKYGKYNPRFIWLYEVTRGQAETVLMSEKLLNKEVDLVIFNIDTMFVSKNLKELLSSQKFDGILGAFNSNEPRFSYAKVDKNLLVTETAEKVVISEFALTGLYHFKNTIDFLDITKKSIANNILSGGEFYIAPMYNSLIEKGKKLTIDICSEHWILGTPKELSLFNKNK